MYLIRYYSDYVLSKSKTKYITAVMSGEFNNMSSFDIFLTIYDKSMNSSNVSIS